MSNDGRSGPAVRHIALGGLVTWAVLDAMKLLVTGHLSANNIDGLVFMTAFTLIAFVVHWTRSRTRS